MEQGSKNSLLQREIHSGELGRCFPGVAKRFELSTGPRKEFLKVTTAIRDEAGNMVGAGKLRDKPDGCVFNHL